MGQNIFVILFLSLNVGNGIYIKLVLWKSFPSTILFRLIDRLEGGGGAGGNNPQLPPTTPNIISSLKNDVLKGIFPIQLTLSWPCNKGQLQILYKSVSPGMARGGGYLIFYDKKDLTWTLGASPSKETGF